MYRAQNTTNKNHRISNDRHAMLKSLAVAAVKTPPKNITNTDQSNPNNGPKERVSKSAISRTLGFNNLSTGLRNLTKAEIKRAQIADDDKDGWCMINEAEEKRIHSAEYLDKVEEWIKNNEKVKISPRMKDTLIKRDRKGRKVLHEDTLQPIRVQRRILLVCPRELHNFMIKDFPFAMEGDKVLVTENKIRKLLKTSCSHVKKFTLRDKRMCGCHACTIFEDNLHASVPGLKSLFNNLKMKSKTSCQEQRNGKNNMT